MFSHESLYTFLSHSPRLILSRSTGVISSTLVSIDTDLSSRPLTTLDKSLITSCTSFFALLASPLTGVLADSYGRRTVIFVADVLFVLGALCQAWTSSVGGMIVGRSIVGAAVGSASFVVPLYISELSPSPFRGRLVVVSSLLVTGGQVVAYVVGWLFSQRVHGWRWMVGLGALPAAVQFVMLFFLPETPRYLVKAGRVQQARAVLGRVYKSEEGGAKLVGAVLRRVEREIEEEEDAAGLRGMPESAKSGWRAKVERAQDNLSQLIVIGGNRRALIIACMLQGFQQLCGFVSIPLILKLPCILTTPPELPHVLLRHNLPHGRLLLPNPNLALHRPHKLPLHSRCLPLHRPHRPPAHPPLLHRNHDPRPHPLRHSIHLRRPARCCRRRNSLQQRCGNENMASYYSCIHDYICSWLCDRYGKCTLAAIRAFSFIRPFAGIGYFDCDELGLEYAGWSYVFAYAASF